MRLAHDQRHFLDDAMLAVDLLGQLLEHLHMPLLAGLGRDPLGAPARLGRQRVHHRPVVDAIVPDLKVAHFGETPDALAVGARDCAGTVGGLVLVAAHEARRHRGTRGQALEIPFPRPGMNLVEIVDREDEVALGGGVDAEVGHVHVAAGVDERADDRGVGKIARHDRGRAAQEGERRSQHARKAHRHQLLDTRDILLLEDRDGIRPVVTLLEAGVLGARHHIAHRLADGQALLHRGPLVGEARQHGEILGGLLQVPQMRPVRGMPLCDRHRPLPLV